MIPGRLPGSGNGCDPDSIERETRVKFLRRVACCAVLLAIAAPSSAFEFFDGRVEVHGFYEQQIRAISRDFETSSEFDLTQWYHILNLEVETGIAPNGWGPFDIIEGFARVEARYDCVWTRACGMFPSVNTYGNRAERLPGRLIDGRRTGQIGQMQSGDHRLYASINRENAENDNRDLQPGRPPSDVASLVDPIPGVHDPLTFDRVPGFVNAFSNSFGATRVFEAFGAPSDDSAPFYTSSFRSDCLFGAINSRGGENGHVSRILGPWNPGCDVVANARLRHLPNPWDQRAFIPVLAGVDNIPGTADDPTVFDGSPDTVSPFGSNARPYRPAPILLETDTGSRADAQGVWYPSAGLVRALRGRSLDSIDQNFRQAELEWNRGSSQQDEKELKEAYLDLEMYGGRLWMRLGKQSTVWGKTELFRTTDQFNPQDLALSSLPNLEESRIALWGGRGTWSFYDIGPLEDVRLEMAFNFDQFEPADLGRCGEPYTLEVACGLTFGYFAHGLTGVGLAGNAKPPSPWNDFSALEAGARVEFRYGRFSFQISDFYGYEDFPYPERVGTYERNVDPTTGRPRRYGATGPCTTGDEPACLGQPNNAVEIGLGGLPTRLLDGVPLPPNNVIYNLGALVLLPEHQQDVLSNHFANQTVFAFGCATTLGIVRQDRRACGIAGFNSQTGPGIPVSTNANGASALIAGSPNANQSAFNTGFIPALLPLVQINRDPGDDTGLFSDGGVGIFSLVGDTLGQRSTPEQEALFGCGPFFSSDCDTDGIDFLNAEASVLFQSWTGFEGTSGRVEDWDTADATLAQPGTLGFVGGPVATRNVSGQLVMLPGSRGPGDPGYDPLVDGCSGPGVFGCNAGDLGRASAANLLIHPLIGPGPDMQVFRSELAAASFNLLMLVASRSDPDNPSDPSANEFDGSNPNRLDGCSFRKPALCTSIQGLLTGSGLTRNSVRAGGTSSFGRRDFVWHQGGEIVLRYQKRNVLGFSMDFTEDTTKTSWGIEATWIEGQKFVDNDQFDALATADTYNVTVSGDRPTFINFLNPNRTFLFNSQWFFQYVNGYKKGFTTSGPLNVLATFTIFTGYFQDRLLLFHTGVYDFRSNSGAFLPTVIYRFTENFSATIGANVFWGRQELRDMPISEIRPGVQRSGEHAYKDAVENGLAALRDRDEARLTLRYTF